MLFRCHIFCRRYRTWPLGWYYHDTHNIHKDINYDGFMLKPFYEEGNENNGTNNHYIFSFVSFYIIILKDRFF